MNSAPPSPAVRQKHEPDGQPSVDTESAPSGADATHSSSAAQFFAQYSEQFAQDFSQQLRDAGDGDDAVIDPQTLYKTLFLSGRARPHDEQVRSSFRQLVDQTPNAEPVLKRTWLIMATNYLDFQVKAGGGDKEGIETLIAEYSQLLNDVYFDASIAAPVTRPDVDTSSDDHRSILKALQAYLNPDTAIRAPRVYSCYQGVPVECASQVLDVDDDSALFYVNRCQISVLAKVPLALIETPMFDSAMRAYATDVDVDARIARFSYFVPHVGEVERREYMRVTPEQPIEVRLRYGNREVTGRLLDLSAVAVAVYFRNVPLYELTEGKMVELGVVMPKLDNKGKLELQIPGKVSKIAVGMSSDPVATRVIVQMHSDKELFSTVSAYVAKRQTEILRALSGLA